MITNTGKNILVKYLLGQVGSYASYIAIGCGPKPLNYGESFGDYSSKQVLDFETARVPITSKGYVIENGVSKIVFTADLPSEERYEITEIGVFPSLGNVLAGNADSKVISKFNGSEYWTKNGLTQISSISGTLDSTISNTTQESIFRVNADNPGLALEPRLLKQERPRFLNDTILIKGGATDYIQSSVQLDLSQNSPLDVLKLAFSVISNSSVDTDPPAYVTISVKFLNANGKVSEMLADMGSSSQNYSGANQTDFSNRYLVYSQTLENLNTDDGFDFKAITGIKVSSVIGGAQGTSVPSDFYIALDGLRIDNISSGNSLYGLVGYSPIRNYTQSGSTYTPKPIVKDQNTSNLIEFRFNIGV